MRESRRLTLACAVGLAGCAAVPNEALKSLSWMKWRVPFLAPELFPAASRLLKGFDERTEAADWRAGDSVLYGLDLWNGKSRRRWLVRLTVRADRSDRSGRVGMTFALSNGQNFRWEFEEPWFPIRFEIFDAVSGARLDRTEADLMPLLAEGFLGLVRPKPGVRRQKQPPYRALGSEALQRFARPSAGMIMLGRVLQSNRVLVHYLLQLIDRPSLWSILWHLGIDLTVSPFFDEFRRTNDEPPNVPPSDEHVIFPLVATVNGNVQTQAEVLAVDPRRPYALLGGIVAAHAENPSNLKKHMDLILLAARLGGNGGQASPR